MVDGQGYTTEVRWPGILMVTVFVTAPSLPRVDPLMQQTGPRGEESRAVLGLGRLGLAIVSQGFTLPNIQWALLYGVVCY